MRRGAMLASMLIACAIIARPAHARQAKLEDVSMAVPTSSLAYTLEFLNQDLGLYEKRSLRVKTVQIEGLGTVNAVISGSVDFGQPSGASLTRAAARGQRLLAIVEIIGRPSAQIVLRKELAQAAAIVKKRFATSDDRLYSAAFEVTRRITPNPPIPTKRAIENTDAYNIAAGLIKPEEKLSSYDGFCTDEYVR